MDKLHNSEDAPKFMPLQLLREITNNFSEDRKLGSGTYGEVFKGVHNGEDVAVKKLHLMPGLFNELEQFKKEFENLNRLRHENIVRLLGYCYETRHEYVVLNDGRRVFAENIYRALCFEYMHNGSLQNHLYDEYHGLDWQTRYKIIKGICKGLRYLHEELESPIYHLDLKPDNILLDKAMVPKLADFGLSKLVHNDQTQTTRSSIGTIGYLPPEYIEGNFVSKKFDIFSLGVVIIRIMTGFEGYSKKAEMSSQEFIDLVHNNWRNRLQATLGCTTLEGECHQVKRCTEIALDCVKHDRKQRPKIGAIIRQLKETEHRNDKLAIDKTCRSVSEVPPTVVSAAPSPLQNIITMPVGPSMTTSESMIVSAAPSQLQRIIGMPKGPGETTREIHFIKPSKASKLLDVHPLELRFPFEPNKVMECPVTLTNMTDHYVDVWITQIDQSTLSGLGFPELQLWSSPWKHKLSEGLCLSKYKMIGPHCSLSVAMKVEQRELPPQDTGKFEVVMIVMSEKEHLYSIKSFSVSKLKKDKNFWEKVDSLGAEVHRVMLSAVICDPTSCQPVIHNHFIQKPLEFGKISYIDVHPTETRILIGQTGGWISVLNYQTPIQHTAIVFQLLPPKPKHIGSYITRSSIGGCEISSARFIAPEEWFAVGDDDGWVHVYSYITKGKIKEVEAYHGKPVSSLAVHATLPFLLTSSFRDILIKLLDWGNGWKCIRTFDIEYSCFPSCIQWNPWDADTFLGASNQGIKVWGLGSSDPVTTFTGFYLGPCCFYSDSHRNFMAAASIYSVDILDMQTNECIHHLKLANDQYITDVACHPTLPLLATISDKYFCLWNTSNFRLEKMVNFTDDISTLRNINFLNGMELTGTDNIARLVIGNREGISVMEINLPTT